MEFKKGQKVKIKDSLERNPEEEIVNNEGIVKEVLPRFIILQVKIKYHYNDGIVMDTDLYIEPKHIEL